MGSLQEPNGLAEAASGCHTFVHLAAAYREADEQTLRWTNVAGTENALNAARHAGVKRFIYVSCADVTLTDNDRLGWDEKQQPQHLLKDAFASTKRLAEEIAIAYHGSAMGVTVLRPALLWGPGDRHHLRRWQAEAAQRGGLALFGRGDTWIGTTFVEHLVDSILLAIRAEQDGEVYYITDGDLVESSHFFGTLSSAMGWPAPSVGPPLLQARLSRRWPKWELVQRTRGTAFSIAKAAQQLSYQPRVSLEEGMRRWAESV